MSNRIEITDFTAPELDVYAESRRCSFYDSMSPNQDFLSQKAQR